MIVENIKKKQNVNTSSNDSAADEDDIMTGQELTSLSGKVRKEDRCFIKLYIQYERRVF